MNYNIFINRKLAGNKYFWEFYIFSSHRNFKPSILSLLLTTVVSLKKISNFFTIRKLTGSGSKWTNENVSGNFPILLTLHVFFKGQIFSIDQIFMWAIFRKILISWNFFPNGILFFQIIKFLNSLHHDWVFHQNNSSCTQWHSPRLISLLSSRVC